MSTTDIIGSSPFSAYAGYKRTIMLLSGGPFTLDFAGEAPTHTLSPLAPFDFSGGWKTYCRLDGPRAYVLNVMTDDDVIYTWRTLSLHKAPTDIVIETSAALLYCAQGDAQLENKTDLPTRHLHRCEMLSIEDGKGLKLQLSSSSSARLVIFAFDLGAAGA